MSMIEDLVQRHPWRMVAGAFAVGVGLALERRTRNAIAMTAFQIGRAITVEYVRRYARAWSAAQDGNYARA